VDGQQLYGKTIPVARCNQRRIHLQLYELQSYR
jgi:hypothetical protein